MVGKPQTGQPRDVVLYVRLSAGELSRLDQLRGRVTRSAYIRSLLHTAIRSQQGPVGAEPWHAQP